MTHIPLRSFVALRLIMSVQRIGTSDTLFPLSMRDECRLRDYGALICKKHHPYPCNGFRRLSIRVLQFIIYVGLAFMCVSCSNLRYIGSISRSGAYVNRGYGVVLPLDEVSDRWWIFDPEHPDKGPRVLSIEQRSERIDLDGDGMLRLDELTTHYRPHLRLLARNDLETSIELDIEILSEPAASKYSLEELFEGEVHQRAENDTVGRLALKQIESLKLAFGRTALVTTIISSRRGGFERIAMIDQPHFEAEEGMQRRQIVHLRLHAAETIEPWLEDYEQLLHLLLAAPQASTETRRERW